MFIQTSHFGTVSLIDHLLDDDSEIIIPSKMIGNVTAYLPEEKIFSVNFPGINWVTFRDETEEEFNSRFEWIERMV